MTPTFAPDDRHSVSFILSLLLAAALLFTTGCSDEDDDKGPLIPSSEEQSLRERFDLQLLGPIPYPPNNARRFERISLGRMLFYDPIISGERDVSCATCHHPAFGFADLRQLSAGVSGQGLGPDRILGNSAMSGLPIEDVPRNAPTIFNTAYNADETGAPSHDGFMFWDGRAKNLDAQATLPITSRVEMRGDAYPGSDAEAAAAALDSVTARLRAIEEYVTRFEMAFPEEAAAWHNGTRSELIDSSTFGRAIGAFERELVTLNTAYDRYVDGDDDALSNSQKRGLELFFTKARCAECHSGPMFADFTFRVNGVPQLGPGKAVIPGDDCGREEHTLNSNDRYAFRTPTLRNVELTAPYMHDGVFATLEEVVEFYDDACQPRHPDITDDLLDPVLREPLNLTDQEQQDLVAFMKALTDNGSQLPDYLMSVPEAVPSGLPPVVGVGAPGF